MEFIIISQASCTSTLTTNLPTYSHCLHVPVGPSISKRSNKSPLSVLFQIKIVFEMFGLH